MESIQAQFKTVSPSWAREWVRKSKSLKLVKPRLVEASRSEGCKKSIIEDWFSTWKNSVESCEIYPSMLANFDETMIQPHTNTKVKVVGFKDTNATVVATEPELPHITLGVTIFADGTHSDHLLIYPSKFVPQEVRGENSANYVHFSIAGQDSGWITKELFAEHCRKTLIPTFLERRARLEKLGVPHAVGVLLVDGHTSRLNSNLMEELRQHNIMMPVLPSHASHVLQPLDLAVFGAFKVAISKGDSSLRQCTLPERRSCLMLKAMKALHLALSPDIILRSWRLSGLHPFDPTTPLKHPCILFKDEDQPMKIDSVAKGHGERYNISGKVITNLAEIESIRVVENKRKRLIVPKFSENQSPSDPSLMEDPESALPPAPKRRGRPPKDKSKDQVNVAPVSAP
jgi:hypothetical protein